MIKKLVVASDNLGKIDEITKILSEFNVEVIPQKKYNVPPAIENGQTFVENAIIKARNACKYVNLPVMADDSGIIVDYLNGAPGVHTARFAGDNATQEDNINLMLEKLAGVPFDRRGAIFHCTIVILSGKDCANPIIAQGNWRGKILEQKQGENGFGYDPIFYCPEYQCSSASLTDEIKNHISHRGQALKSIVSKLKDS